MRQISQCQGTHGQSCLPAQYPELLTDPPVLFAAIIILQVFRQLFPAQGIQLGKEAACLGGKPLEVLSLQEQSDM